nr:serine hydrolase domain-containing protein [uncultured Roseovarius sp.]
MTDPATHPNPDLVACNGQKPAFHKPENRRKGFQSIHLIQRYALTFRSDHVLTLARNIDTRIGLRDDVRRFVQTNEFSAMAVVRNQTLIYEAYAPDFGAQDIHTAMSITKLTANLIIGELVAAGKVDLNKTVGEYLPKIGSGYAKASVQQVLHMDVDNDYTEDYEDPQCSCFDNEAAWGLRLPVDGQPEQSAKEYLCTITGSRETLENRTDLALYKSANTDVLGWIAEEVSGRSVRAWILDIVEATGIENVMTVATDREGFPMLGGGISMTARDMARFGQLFCRYGRGVGGRRCGDPRFIANTMVETGRQVKPLLQDVYYSNQTFTNGEWIGHAGYGGQFLLANMKTGVSVSFFSVLETEHATCPQYQAELIRMMEQVSRIV